MFFAIFESFSEKTYIIVDKNGGGEGTELLVWHASHAFNEDVYVVKILYLILSIVFRLSQ